MTAVKDYTALDDMDRAIKNFNKGEVSSAIDLSDF